MDTAPTASPDALNVLRAYQADDDLGFEVRACMIDRDDPDVTAPVRELVDSLHRDDRSTLALELSLCPLHEVDYAICFDDENPECAALRACFPSHDT